MGEGWHEYEAFLREELERVLINEPRSFTECSNRLLTSLKVAGLLMRAEFDRPFYPFNYFYGCTDVPNEHHDHYDYQGRVNGGHVDHDGMIVLGYPGETPDGGIYPYGIEPGSIARAMLQDFYSPRITMLLEKMQRVCNIMPALSGPRYEFHDCGLDGVVYERDRPFAQWAMTLA